MTGSAQVRLVGPGDAPALAELFAAIDATHFHPHPLTFNEAKKVVAYRGGDVYAVVAANGQLAAYGLLRGWDEGFDVPSLGIAVRTDKLRLGYGRLLMHWLADQARMRGAKRLRLRVNLANVPARRMYESLGYADIGEDRGERVMVLDLGG